MEEKSIRAWVDSQAALYDKFYLKKHSVTLRAITWNVAEKAPSGSLSALFTEPNGTPSDIVFIGLQEVDMSASALINHETDFRLPWRGAVLRDLAVPTNYTLLVERQLCGLYALLLARTNIAPFVGVQDVRSVSAGFMGGALGNKGGIVVSLKVFESTVCLVNAHLAAHQKETERRTQQLRMLLDAEVITEQRLPGLSTLMGARIRPNGSSMPATATSTKGSASAAKQAPPSDASSLSDLLRVTTPFDHDALIVVGDLNYRVDVPVSTCAALLQPCAQQKDWAPLHTADQLLTTLHGARALAAQQCAVGGAEDAAVDVLALLRTAVPSFPPTYKFEPGTNVYCGVGVDAFGQKAGDRCGAAAHEGKKARVPSWTDRFVWADAASIFHVLAAAEGASGADGPGVREVHAAEAAAAARRRHVRSARRLSSGEAGMDVSLCVGDDDVEALLREGRGSYGGPDAALVKTPGGGGEYCLEAAPAAEVSLVSQRSVFEGAPLMISDHRPVIGTFLVNVLRVDERARTMVRRSLDQRLRRLISEVNKAPSKALASSSGGELTKDALLRLLRPVLRVSMSSVSFCPITYSAASPAAVDALRDIAPLVTVQSSSSTTRHSPERSGRDEGAATPPSRAASATLPTAKSVLLSDTLRSVTLRNPSACVCIVRAAVQEAPRTHRPPPLVEVNSDGTFGEPLRTHSCGGTYELWPDHSTTCAYSSALAQLLRAAAASLKVPPPEGVSQGAHDGVVGGGLPRGIAEQWASRVLAAVAAAAVTVDAALLALPPASACEFGLRVAFTGPLLTAAAIADTVLRCVTADGFSGRGYGAARLLSTTVAFAVHGGEPSKLTVEIPLIPSWLGAPVELLGLPYAAHNVAEDASGAGKSKGGNGGDTGARAGSGGASDRPFDDSAFVTTSSATQSAIVNAVQRPTPSIPPIPPPLFDLLNAAATAAAALSSGGGVDPTPTSSTLAPPATVSTISASSSTPPAGPFASYVAKHTPHEPTLAPPMADADDVAACLTAVVASRPPLAPNPALCHCAAVPASPAVSAWHAADSAWGVSTATTQLHGGSNPAALLAAALLWVGLLPNPLVPTSAYGSALRAATSAAFELTGAVEAVLASLRVQSANIVRAICALVGHLLKAEGYEVLPPDDSARSSTGGMKGGSGSTLSGGGGLGAGFTQGSMLSQGCEAMLMPILRRTSDGVLFPIAARSNAFSVLYAVCRGLFGRPPGSPPTVAAAQSVTSPGGGGAAGSVSSNISKVASVLSGDVLDVTSEERSFVGLQRCDSLAPIPSWPLTRVVRCEVVFVLEVIRLCSR